MMPLRPSPHENPLWVSWHDTQMMATLNPQNIMDYFCRKSNPFYDHLCNNENIRMQRLSMDHLNDMVGLEYILLHVAEPILYVIRKQHRHSPAEATPVADYYIIGGMVYKAPDLANVINSRVLGTITTLQTAFEEASSYARYHPNKGYTWDFTSNKALSDECKTAGKKDPTAPKDDNGTVFQMQRVDMLLAELLRKFPPPMPPQIQQKQQQQLQQAQPVSDTSTGAGDTVTNLNNNVPVIKQETETSSNTAAPTQPTLEPKIESVSDMKPPLEKKIKI